MCVRAAQRAVSTHRTRSLRVPHLGVRGAACCAGAVGTRFGDGDLVRKIPVEPFGKVFQEAKKAATSFILQRVAPLSQLNYVDDECADVLEEPDVKKALKVRAAQTLHAPLPIARTRRG